ncbi:MobP2 family relaxase [Metabacillus fastidiosus]|uniref:MobP2 family relaxase n=1 Tax=Metabacillus fastidiosus TaxID=1458 RepID=UPI003D2B84C6
MSQTAIMPAVVLKTRFVTSEKSSFKNYVDYVDRDEAKQNNEKGKKSFLLYQDYMDNPDKTSSLFTEKSDHLNKEEKKELKGLFKKAQENNSIMWQDVISFDNKWLEEHGVYNSNSHTVDEGKLKNVTRLAMQEMIKREQLDKSSVWSAAIHYNTDNIHIHIATVEPNPTRERGKRKPQTLDAMKSKVVNNIIDRGPEQKRINDLIRKNMVDKKKEDSIFKWRNRELKPLFLHVYNQLPEDKRQWQYGYNTIKHLRPTIDEMTTKYIQKYHRKDYELFERKLEKEVEVLKQSYGEGKFDKKRYEDYKQNKIDELYKRMGNAFLKEMRDYDTNQKRINGRVNQSRNKKCHSFIKNTSLLYTMSNIEKCLKSEYESWKDLRHYERLEKEIEKENNQEREY